MQNRTGLPRFYRGLLIVFSIFFILSLAIIIFRQQLAPVSGQMFEYVVTPLQKMMYSAFGGLLQGNNSSVQVAYRELAKQLVDQRELEKEARALRDQYDSELFSSGALLPARVIGFKSFIPGVSLPEEIVVDKGSRDGVIVGQTVMLTDNLVGSVNQVTDRRALISLISASDQSLAAQANKTEALGVIKGKGNGAIVFENVVLADSLEKGDIIITHGSEDINGTGYPPGLVIGRIVSVDKKVSDLFQSAEIKSLIDFSKLHTVFILTEATETSEE